MMLPQVALPSERVLDGVPDLPPQVFLAGIPRHLIDDRWCKITARRCSRSPTVKRAVSPAVFEEVKLVETKLRDGNMSTLLGQVQESTISPLFRRTSPKYREFFSDTLRNASRPNLR